MVFMVQGAPSRANVLNGLSVFSQQQSGNDGREQIQTVRQRLESAPQENDHQAVSFADNAGRAEDSTSSLSDMLYTDSAASMAVSAGTSKDEHDLLDIMAQSTGRDAPAGATSASATDRQGEDEDVVIQNRARSHDHIAESKEAEDKNEGCNPAKNRKTEDKDRTS